ncbi:putative serine/threonine-protein kinase [Aphelenchoides fujianensis]|nr:putative serine/threonine-protein kinase [Aphelenchoides fujianensis]
MAVPPAPARIALGDKVKDTWLVKKKLGEGSCGVVYLVQSLKHAGPEGRAALKVEPFMKCKDDEILKMEVFVLRKMQQSRHVCRLLMAGKEKNYRRARLPFMVISLLGKELSELRRRFPDRKMPPASTLKVGLQTLQAIQDLHAGRHDDLWSWLVRSTGKRKQTDPFEWELSKAKHKEEERAPEKERDEKAEIDKMEDTDTHRDVDESVESAASDGHSDTKGFAKEDTLEVASDVQK